MNANQKPTVKMAANQRKTGSTSSEIRTRKSRKTPPVNSSNSEKNYLQVTRKQTNTYRKQRK